VELKNSVIKKTFVIIKKYL